MPSVSFFSILSSRSKGRFVDPRGARPEDRKIDMRESMTSTKRDRSEGGSLNDPPSSQTMWYILWYCVIQNEYITEGVGVRF